MNKDTIEAGKATAITSYILGIGVFIAMSMNADTKIHLLHFIFVKD